MFVAMSDNKRLQGEIWTEMKSFYFIFFNIKTLYVLLILPFYWPWGPKSPQSCRNATILVRKTPLRTE